MKRRTFLLASSAAPLIVNGAPPSDRINIAAIGLNGQGGRLAQSFANQKDVRIAALCDVDERVYPKIADAIEKGTGVRPPFVKDLRRVLEDKSIDAILNGTPDHWHAPATIMACDAGKDAYSEKPASHNAREGRLMVEAARRNKRIVQIGIQSRSRPSTLRAMEIISSGKLGRIYMAKAWDVQLRDDIGRKPDSPPPPGLDYDTWVGPAPMMPFNENRFHYKWHWNWNFGTGDLGNDGVHQLDMARWALGVDSPQAISGMGRKIFFDDDQQTPDTMNLTFDFGSKLIQFEMRIWNPYGLEGQQNGVAVYGSDGMIHIGRWPRLWGYRVYDSAGKLIPEISDDAAGEGGDHHRNFLDCIKSRKAPNGDVEIGHTSTMLCHLGNIVAKVKRNIRFDGKSESIVNDDEAASLLRRRYRDHWSVPKGARTT